MLTYASDKDTDLVEVFEPIEGGRRMIARIHYFSKDNPVIVPASEDFPLTAIAWAEISGYALAKPNAQNTASLQDMARDCGNRVGESLLRESTGDDDTNKIDVGKGLLISAALFLGNAAGVTEQDSIRGAHQMLLRLQDIVNNEG